MQFCLRDRSCPWLCLPSPVENEGSLLGARQPSPPMSWGGLMSCVSWSSTLSKPGVHFRCHKRPLRRNRNLSPKELPVTPSPEAAFFLTDSSLPPFPSITSGFQTTVRNLLQRDNNSPGSPFTPGEKGLRMQGDKWLVPSWRQRAGCSQSAAASPGAQPFVLLWRDGAEVGLQHLSV